MAQKFAVCLVSGDDMRNHKIEVIELLETFDNYESAIGYIMSKLIEFKTDEKSNFWRYYEFGEKFAYKMFFDETIRDFAGIGYSRWYSCVCGTEKNLKKAEEEKWQDLDLFEEMSYLLLIKDISREKSDE